MSKKKNAECLEKEQIHRDGNPQKQREAIQPGEEREGDQGAACGQAQVFGIRRRHPEQCFA